MGWFDEQVRLRKRRDEEMYERSYDNISRKILGESVRKGNVRRSVKSTIYDIFAYYNLPKVEIPSGIEKPLDQIEYAAGAAGIMKANITIKGNWFTDCFGPIICFLKVDHSPIVFYPLGFAGYYYYDPISNKKTIATKKTTEILEEDAVAFYQPLPLKKIGIPDLIGYMRNRLTGYDYVYFALATLALVLFSMALPRAAVIMTGRVVDEKNYELFAGVALVIIGAIIFSGFFQALKTYVLSRIRWKVTIPVEQAVMQRILTLPVPFFRQFSSGELSNRAESVNSICEILINDVFSLGMTSVISLLYLQQISNISDELLLPSVAIIGLTIGLSSASTVLQMGISKKTMELGAKEAGLSYAILNGIQKIKLAGAEKRIFAKWAEFYAEGAALTYNPPFFLKINNVLNVAISLIGTIIFYDVAIKSGITASEYYAFNIAYAAVFASFTQLSAASLSVAKVKPVLEMAEPILQTEPEKTLKKDIATRINGSIEINGVYFRYNEDTPYILENFSLKIKSGEYVAVVGKTGCGKSTLVRLLLGFEKPEKGLIFFDGKDIARIDLKSLRRKIGSVIQDAQLFYGDIFDNIAIASEKLSEEEAWEAAEMAGIADDIRAMPMGMNTIISEGQGGISGGQRQRILIARAVASKPKILIFDEATSALDNITQKQIAQSLDELKCTRIVIAHRLSTIKNCDRILVMDAGKIVEEGSYDDLMAKGGYFADLVKRQQL